MVYSKPWRRAIVTSIKAKLESFARQYVINHFNGQQAAIAAGFAPKSAKVTASRLLTKANVKALIARFAAPTIKKEQVTVERTLVELARLAYLDPGQIVDENNKLLPIHAMPADVRACIAGMDTSAKGKVTHVKIAARPGRSTCSVNVSRCFQRSVFRIWA